MEGEARVAVVGAGRMGAAMVGTLRRAGVEVVVFNRTRSRAEATGGAVAATAREAAAGAQVVLSSLADDDAVEAAYTGPDDRDPRLALHRLHLRYCSSQPASTYRLAPVTDRFSSRNTTAPTTSCMVVSCRDGTSLRYRSRTASPLALQ